ncbi:MAG: hypothetical protein J7621_29630, partial [Niastella sp.]|nr:hypothetical protein [Niastella sp.]
VAASGKPLKATDPVKTVSGKTITLEDYLQRLNKVEEEMAQKGYTLRNFKSSPTNLLRRPAVVEESRINSINTEINRNVKPLSNLSSNTQKIFIHKNTALASQRAAGLTVGNTAAIQKVRDLIVAGKHKPETIEKVYDIKTYLTPLVDKIGAEMDNDDASLKLDNASLKVRSFVDPPAAITAVNADIFNATESEYKVAVTFGASMDVSVGLPISINIPLATMNGEFVAPAKTSKNLSRKVVVNLMGRSLFNRTAAVNGESLFEDLHEEMDIAELIGTPAMGAANFLDWIPSVGFNTNIYTSGTVGCLYKVDMVRSNVDAYIGPTYGTRLRVEASFGKDDMLEGGIEGIVTLLTGGLGFGGNAGLDYVDNKWKLINKAYIESSLEVLKGEVNFFVRYPDFKDWSCGFPCIRTDRFSIFKTPSALKLRGTLLEEDNSKILNW